MIYHVAGEIVNLDTKKTLDSYAFYVKASDASTAASKALDVMRSSLKGVRWARLKPLLPTLVLEIPEDMNEEHLVELGNKIF